MRLEEAAAVLGIDVHASVKDAKASHRARAQLLHPDKHAHSPTLSDVATKSMQQLNQALAAFLTLRGSSNSHHEPSAHHPGPSRTGQRPSRRTGRGGSRVRAFELGRHWRYLSSTELRRICATGSQQEE